MRKTPVNAHARAVAHAWDLVRINLVFVIMGFLYLPIGLTMAGEPTSGKDLYQKKCSLCHGADGIAKPMASQQGGRNFNDPAWQKEMTDDAIARVISEGMPEKKMPSYKGLLKPEDIAAIVKYIRTLAAAK